MITKSFLAFLVLLFWSFDSTNSLRTDSKQRKSRTEMSYQTSENNFYDVDTRLIDDLVFDAEIDSLSDIASDCSVSDTTSSSDNSLLPDYDQINSNQIGEPQNSVPLQLTESDSLDDKNAVVDAAETNAVEPFLPLTAVFAIWRHLAHRSESSDLRRQIAALQIALKDQQHQLALNPVPQAQRVTSPQLLLQKPILSRAAPPARPLPRPAQPLLPVIPRVLLPPLRPTHIIKPQLRAAQRREILARIQTAEPSGRNLKAMTRTAQAISNESQGFVNAFKGLFI